MTKPKPELTPEQLELRRAQLAKGRETAARNRAAKAALPKEAAAAPKDAEPVVKLDAARRLRLLEGIDPEIADLITDAELDEIEAEERAKAEAERKKQALGTVRAQMRQRARVENDLIAADVLRTDAEKKRLRELVKFRVMLPNDGAGHRGQNGFRVDGRLYQHGHTYTEPRAVFEALQANHYRAWLNEVQFKTLDQHKPGQSAKEVLGHQIPAFEIAA
jgi:hypothetical protein